MTVGGGDPGWGHAAGARDNARVLMPGSTLTFGRCLKLLDRLIRWSRRSTPDVPESLERYDMIAAGETVNLAADQPGLTRELVERLPAVTQ